MKKPTLTLTESLALCEERSAALCGGLAVLPPDLIEAYLGELIAFNEHTNLVANADPERLVRDHVLDSLSLRPLMLADRPDGEPMVLVDIGSGAGFPGIILALSLPDLKVTLVESVGKKAAFLKAACRRLGLDSRVDVVTERAEDLGRLGRYRERADVATARAVGPLSLLMELSFPLLKVGGSLYAQKSKAQVQAELAAAPSCARAIGGACVVEVDPGREILERDVTVLKVTKTAPTPVRYPRSMAQIKRSPLGAPV